MKSPREDADTTRPEAYAYMDDGPNDVEIIAYVALDDGAACVDIEDRFNREDIRIRYNGRLLVVAGRGL